MGIWYGAPWGYSMGPHGDMVWDPMGIWYGTPYGMARGLALCSHMICDFVLLTWPTLSSIYGLICSPLEYSFECVAFSFVVYITRDYPSSIPPPLLPFLTLFPIPIDVLKISDFGLSTVFRHMGKERKLNRKCGTPPYVAPEVR